MLIYLMRVLHDVVGITAPEPEYESTVVLIWLGVLVVILGGTLLLGYLLMTQIASAR